MPLFQACIWHVLEGVANTWYPRLKVFSGGDLRELKCPRLNVAEKLWVSSSG